MNRIKVLVFTNFAGWGNMSEIIKDRIIKDEESMKSWKESYPSQNLGIVRYDSKNNQAELVPVKLNQQSITDEEGIFLVYDELFTVNSKEFELLKEQCSGDTLYILAHKNGKYPLEKFSNWGCKGYKEESHMPEKSNSYSKLFDILTDSKGDEMNRIINQVFQPVLEMVLGLLHQCLADDNFAPELSPLVQSCPKNSVVEKAFVAYKSDKNLETLREHLLDYALAQN